MKTGSFIHFDHPCAAVHWEDEDRIVRIEWKKATDGATFRRALEALEVTDFEVVDMGEPIPYESNCVLNPP